MSVSLYQVDAFADAPFAGNPAAVCLLSSDRSTSWMQNVAAEMNLSETAFLRRRSDGTVQLRWFTPSHEVDLCGHATLASAHVLWSEGILAPDEAAHFTTASGPLTARKKGDWIAMDFPTDPVTPVDPPRTLLDALGLSDPVFVGQSERDYLVHVDTASSVEALAPTLPALASLDTRGVIVTAPWAPPDAASDDAAAPASASDDDPDFVSRFFAPGVDVPEDPVTGSAHCALGPYWAERTGRTTLTGRQVSPRGGTVGLHLSSPAADRVELTGRAVTVLRGRLAA